MADRLGNGSSDWPGRLVRVLVVFRTLVLLVTLTVLPASQHTAAVMGAALLAALISYLPLRHWDRIGETVSRHPAYLALEVIISTIVLGAAGVRSPFFYFTLGTAVLAGIIYGRRGAIPFSALLICAYELVALEGLPSLHPNLSAETILFAPLLYPGAIAAGIAARELVERGVQSETMIRERTEALSAERERLRVARELHDSLAKTVEGLAMSASALPGRCEKNPPAAAALARTLADDARQAALEARMLMSGLRPGSEPELSLEAALRQRAGAFAERAGVSVEVIGDSSPVSEPLAPDTMHELLRIVGEAMTNAATHGAAARISLSVHEGPQGLAVQVSDDGDGLAQPVDLERLKAAGHFGLAGMQERARNLGGELHVAPGVDHGTTVTVRLPCPGAARPDAPTMNGSRSRWPAIWRREPKTPPAAAVRERP